MNTENLHELINRYEDNYAMVNNSTHDEKFKWGAVRGFRDIWFSDNAASMTFAQLFDAATKRSSVLINNSVISPTTGIVKMAEQDRLWPDPVDDFCGQLRQTARAASLDGIVSEISSSCVPSSMILQRTVQAVP